MKCIKEQAGDKKGYEMAPRGRPHAERAFPLGAPPHCYGDLRSPYGSQVIDFDSFEGRSTQSRFPPQPLLDIRQEVGVGLGLPPGPPRYAHTTLTKLHGSTSGHNEEGVDPQRHSTLSRLDPEPRDEFGMTRRRMPGIDETAMDDLVDDFEDMGTDRRKDSTRGGRPQGRRESRYLNDTDSSDNDIESYRSWTRDARHIKRGATRPMDDVDSFDGEDIEPRRLSRRGGRQDGRDPRHFDDVDGSDDEDIEPRRLSTRSGHRSRRGVPRYMDIEDSFDDQDTDPCMPLTRGGPQGTRGAATAPGYIDEPADDMVPHLLEGGRGSRYQTAKPKSSPLRELEAELDSAEERSARFQRGVERSKRSGTGKDASRRDREKQICRLLEDKISEIKMDIYEIDPESVRVDSTAESFSRSNGDGYNHDQRGARDGCRGPAPRRGGDHDRYGARRQDACDD